MWFMAAAAMAGSDVGEGVAVGAATLGGQLALGIGGGAAGLALGSSMCDPEHSCMGALMAIPLGGLGFVLGAPIGAGIGAHAVNRNPWRTVAFVGLAEAGALAIAAGGLATSSDELLLLSGVAGVVAPSVVAGVAAGTGADDFRVAVLPDLGREKVGVRLVASF